MRLLVIAVIKFVLLAKCDHNSWSDISSIVAMLNLREPMMDEFITSMRLKERYCESKEIRV